MEYCRSRRERGRLAEDKKRVRNGREVEMNVMRNSGGERRVIEWVVPG